MRTSDADFVPRLIIILLSTSFVLFLLLLLVFELYAHLKSKRKGPITLTPVVPFPQNDLQIFKGTDRLRNVVPDAKIQVYNGRTEGCFALRPPNWCVMVKVNEFMASTFYLHSRLPDEYEEVRSETAEKRYRLLPKISVPNNARTISIKMHGYEHGEKCHDFVPIRGAVPGSHFTYQMYGDNRIQVTRYVVDGESEIAGFCIYIENPRLSQAEYRWALLHDMAKSATTSTWPRMSRSVEITGNSQTTGGRRNEANKPRIEVIPEENTELISQDSEENYQGWTIKYCSKLRRKVMSGIGSGEIVVHQEWIHRNNQMRIEKCEECTKEGLEKEEQPPAYSSIFID
ncbi:unnamed protein product [Caenorhabditis brenneri]